MKDKNKSRKGKRGQGRKNFKGQNNAKLLREDKAADEREMKDHCAGPNNPIWYAANPQLLVDYASFPYGIPLGSVLPTEVGIDYANRAVPGVCRLGFTPCVGESNNADDPINIAARNIYSFVRHVNSGHSNYDSPDMMLYIMGMSSVYVYHEWMKRVVRIILDYSILNRYYPDAFLIAMGLDPVDMRENISQLRGYVNIYAVKAGSMCVPATMTYAIRHMWMTSGLYADSTSAKAQVYFFDPDYYYQYGLTSGENPVGQLTYVPGPGKLGTPWKVQDIINFGDSLLRPILTSEDMNIMSGDILKAFTVNGIVKLAGVSENEALLPDYSEEVMSQIENATVMNLLVTGSISQNTEINGGYLYANYGLQYVLDADQNIADSALSSFRNNINMSLGSLILNQHKDSVTPADTMVATRLMNKVSFTGVVDSSQGKAYSVSLFGIASEFISSGSVHFAQVTATGFIWARKTFDYIHPSMHNIEGATGYFTSAMDSILALSQFDWCPASRIILGSYDGSAIKGSPVHFSNRDLDNYTIITPRNLQDLAKVALLSQLSVPQMGAFSAKLSG